MEKAPLLTFVVPTKNRIEWLGECLMSLLTQTEKDIEIIVINDGSTDGTKEFLDAWPKDERVRIIHNEESLGAGVCRRMGTEMATSGIICQMDDDDISVAERAEKTLEWFKNNPDSELVNFPYASIGYNNEFVENYEGAPFDYEAYKKDGRINYFCNPSVAYKKEAYLSTKGYEKENDKETDDRQFVRNWIEAGKKIDFVPGDSLLCHRVLPDSMCVKFRGFDPKWVEAA